MAENYGTLEGTLDEHGVLSGEMNDRATLEGEIQFGSGGGGVLDVFQNGQSVVQGRYAYVTVPTFLRELRSDDYHNTVTSLEMQIWNGKADPSDIPTALSQLDNDANYVQDADYVHTDNNFTDEDKAAIGNIPENITDLSDVAVDNIQNGQVLKWDATQEKFVNADESGGGGDVTDVKVNNTSVVDAQGVANIDLTGYAETTDIHNPTITIQKNGQNVDTFTLNQTTNKVIDISVPTKTSDLQNDSSFITNTVNNLANYYLKTQTYTQAEVDALIDAAINGRFQKVNVLPATGEPNVIYLVPKATPETSNACDEYIWQDNAWELIGSTDIDLSGYVTDDELTTALQDYLTTSAFNTAIANYYTKTEVGNLLDDKVDKISGKGLSTNDYDNTAKGIVDGVTAALADKVDKETGKGLSTNDYTTTEKNKLAGIAAGATKTASSTTNGNIKINDVETQVYDDSEIQDKIDETTTSISGNPISISGLKANQLAKDPIITFEPIQAGSGTPSPSNIRAISGYDKVEVLSGGDNLFDSSAMTTGAYLNADGTTTSSGQWNITDYIEITESGAIYKILASAGNAPKSCWYNANKQFISSFQQVVGENAVDKPADAEYLRMSVYTNEVPTFQVRNKVTSISESLGQTVYGGSLDVRTGKAKIKYANLDLSTLSWSYNSGWNCWASSLSAALVNSNDTPINAKADRYDIVKASGYTTSHSANTLAMNTNKYLFVDNGSTTTSPTGQLVYELATYGEIQLTPHEISLLKDYAYLSTNGTSIALDYHNGELASLGDVSQLGETVNELGKYVNAEHNEFDSVVNISSTTASNKYTFPNDGYIFINGRSNTTGYIRVYTYGKTSNAINGGLSINITGVQQMASLFVRKGMRCYVDTNITGTSIQFIPLV